MKLHRLTSCVCLLFCFEKSTAIEKLDDWLSEHLIPAGYDSAISHASISKESLDISLELTPITLVEVSEVRMEYDMDLYLHIHWKDFRLNNSQTLSTQTSCRLPREIPPLLWIPSIIYMNCRKCNDEMYLIDLNMNAHNFRFNFADKEIVVSYREDMKFNCRFNLKHYPFDTHTCYMYVGIHHSVMNDADLSKMSLVAQNDDEHISGSFKNNLPPEFRLQDYHISNNCPHFAQGMKHSPIADRNPKECLQYKIVLERILSHHVLILYIPSCLIVMVSWISFWIDVDNTAPRVALGLTSLLTLTTQFSSAQKNLPAVAYVKAVDIWMITCVMYVFASLVEFALSNFFFGTGIIIKEEQPFRPKPVMPQFYPIHYKWKAKRVSPLFQPPTPKFKKRINFFDVGARIIFPVSFAIFNFAYWGFYLS